MIAAAPRPFVAMVVTTFLIWQADEQQIYIVQKKKSVQSERNNMKKQKEEAELYKSLADEQKELLEKLCASSQ